MLGAGVQGALCPPACPPIFINNGGGLEWSPKPAISQQLHGGAVAPAGTESVLGADLIHISSFHPWNGPDRWQLSPVLQVGKPRQGLGMRNLVGAAWLLPRGNRDVTSVCVGCEGPASFC